MQLIEIEQDVTVNVDLVTSIVRKANEVHYYITSGVCIKGKHKSEDEAKAKYKELLYHFKPVVNHVPLKAVNQ